MLRPLTGDHGQTTTEWLGIGLVVVVLVLALVRLAPDLAGGISEAVQALVCRVAGSCGA